ncbi:MAG: hypothetical protein ABI587_13065 [Gemmatimonadales bacterium]
MLRSARSLRLLSLTIVLAGLVSCASYESPTAPAAAALQLPIVTPLLNGLLACRPQPYAITRQTVGSAGGTIRVGGHTLVIPSGALRQPVLITAEAPGDAVASVRFQPEGLQFARSARLTLDYSACPGARLQLGKHIAYTTENLRILNLLLSLDDILGMRVSGNLDHFSRYAVAW